MSRYIVIHRHVLGTRGIGPVTQVCSSRPKVGDAELPSSAEEAQIMAMPTVSQPVTTIEELLALPEDGQRHELLDGVHAVTPAPTYGHQHVLSRLFSALVEALKGRSDLEVLSSPADIVLAPRTLVQPDLFVLRVDPEAPPRGWQDVGVPVLAIEILSPGTAARDRGIKRRIYQRAGVAEYWIVDIDARLMERWRPDDLRPEIVDASATWGPDGAPLLSVDLNGLFGPLSS
jgi:Uma2 family endonuclease